MDSFIMGYKRKRKKTVWKGFQASKKNPSTSFYEKKGLLISKIPDLRIYT